MDLQSLSLIGTFLLVITASVGGGLLARYFKLPLVLGYIFGGILIGNLFPHVIDSSLISLIADVGVTLLLFTIGIEFSFHRLEKVLAGIIKPATIQIAGTIGLFFIVNALFGFAVLPSLFIAVAVGLSSTAVIIKYLTERGERETVPGELVTGWLVVQDLSVIPIMILLPVIGLLFQNQSFDVLKVSGAIGLSFLKAGIVLMGVIVLGKRGIPKLLVLFARTKSRELLLIATIGIVFFFAILAFSFGLPAALGAFIAGLLIAETSQNHAVFSEIRPLRDLFTVVFFVSLGLTIPLGVLVKFLPALIALGSFVIFLKWGFVFGLVRMFGYHRKTAFLAGVYLIPLSEFGFVIAREGLHMGALTLEEYRFIVSLTFMTLSAGTLLFSKSHVLYYRFNAIAGQYLPQFFPVDSQQVKETDEFPYENHIVICGYGRVGKYIGRALEMTNIPYVVVDYNHAVVQELREKSAKVVYGDPADADVLDVAQVDHAKAIVIAIPDRHTQELIIGNAQTLNRRIRIICRTHFEEDQNYLKSLGVHTIVQPEFEAALSIVTRLLTEFGVSDEDISGKISRLKIEHGLG